MTAIIVVGFNTDGMITWIDRFRIEQPEGIWRENCQLSGFLFQESV